jgi:hypothetical protein
MEAEADGDEVGRETERRRTVGDRERRQYPLMAKNLQILNERAILLDLLTLALDIDCTMDDPWGWVTRIYWMLHGVRPESVTAESLWEATVGFVVRDLEDQLLRSD